MQQVGRSSPECPEAASADPDGALVAAIANGDRRAARLLVERHLPKMIAVGRRMLGTQEDAEDVAQEVFLRVWTHAAKWKPGAARFETWMHRVAINLCYDRLRRRRETPVENVPDRIDDGPGPAQALQSAQVARRVARALEDLPDRQRAAIVLCHHQGLSNIEAAGIMEISVEALESLLARGRRGLKARLMCEADSLLGQVDG